MTLKQQLTAMGVVLLSACTVDAGDAADKEALGQSESTLCRNALSPNQEKTALKLIDDICGDTWCEGDNNFAFQGLTCRASAPDSPNGGTCVLKLQIIPREDAPPSYARTCATDGFRGFDSLVETTASGYQSLVWDYYLALSDCISELEAQLPR